MNLLAKIKNYSAPTQAEERLINHISNFTEEAIRSSVHKLAEEAGVSPAAIVRFSKKIGCQGFGAFKLALAADIASEKDSAGLIQHQQISYGDDIETIIKKSRLANINVVEQTYQLIDIEAMINAVNSMRQARHIFLFGIGASGACCTDLAHKLSRIGVETVYNVDFHAQVASSVNITGEDVVIGISYSGDKKEIISAIEYGRKQGAYIIALTQHNNNALYKLADSKLVLPSLEHDLRVGAIASRNASLIYTDLLYLGFISDDFDSYLEKFKLSREMIKTFYD
ncbi:MAG: MurR/RpiR family transcriptional regulator [Defluviitaleaceae bacterium]|nr:MurR/RpiR family transcriptional regulator [Defluviitaleaceae bacterium]